MSEKIYIGNLPWSVSETEIIDLLQPFSQVHSVDLISDRKTGRFRGFGFAEVENAERAIEELNERDFNGRPLKVNLAKERAEGAGRRFDSDSSQDTLSTTKVYVGNLPWNSSEDEIKEVFSQFGEVMSVSIVSDSRTGRSRGFCFVEMDNIEAAVEGLENIEFGGRNLKVQAAKERAGRY